ncbi:MAG TPA: hypothetical protein ENI06_04820 [Spirochaetales bacterium]|nr:hypothetical protein [Spirochaetales bacterium]
MQKLNCPRIYFALKFKHTVNIKYYTFESGFQNSSYIFFKLIDLGYLVIASGGGGVPVILEKEGLKGVFAVVDKDLAGERMAEAIEANEFYIFTDIDKVKLNFHKPNEKSIDRMSLSEAREYLEEGHFLPGSMLTKVKACIRFLEGGSGKKAFISKLSKAKDVLYGKGGTEIYKD